MKWYIPNWSGDFRLKEADMATYRDAPEAACVLEVSDPTRAEQELIAKYLKSCDRKGWKRGPFEVQKKGTQEVLIETSMSEAGKALVRLCKPHDRSITALMYKDGYLEVAEGTKSKELDKLADKFDQQDDKAEADEKKEEETTALAKKPKAAVTVSRPTTCCPECVPGAMSRASEALLAFLTPEEHETWAQHRYIIVDGGYTGNRYLLAHRHSARAVRQGKICLDLDDNVVVHFHDNSVPPEEEILASKLILEHRESWLRNEATFLGMGDYFKNPFGDSLDGVQDASLTAGIGAGLMGAGHYYGR